MRRGKGSGVCRVATVALLVGAVGGGCAEAEHDHGEAAAIAGHGLYDRTGNEAALEDPADLRPGARAILDELAAGRSGYPRGRRTFALTTLPKTIRLFRRTQSTSGATSCTGKVVKMDLEEYVKGVVPHEWIASWHAESLKAGAVAVRTYATAWISRGGKYTCADLDDTTRSQVYKDTRNAAGTAAVNATKGQVLLNGSKVVFAEYSAENSDPTKFGVKEPLCTGRKLFGHGRGMCQWGSQRWALSGKKYLWIAEHYYPGAKLTTLSGTVPKPDSGPAPRRDAGVKPRLDTRPAPRRDATAPRIDTIATRPRTDAGTLPPTAPGSRNGLATPLEGGCATAGRSANPKLPALGILSLALLLSVRRRASA